MLSFPDKNEAHRSGTSRLYQQEKRDGTYSRRIQPQQHPPSAICGHVRDCRLHMRAHFLRLLLRQKSSGNPAEGSRRRRCLLHRFERGGPCARWHEDNGSVLHSQARRRFIHTLPRRHAGGIEVVRKNVGIRTRRMVGQRCQHGGKRQERRRCRILRHGNGRIHGMDAQTSANSMGRRHLEGFRVALHASHDCVRQEVLQGFLRAHPREIVFQGLFDRRRARYARGAALPRGL